MFLVDSRVAITNKALMVEVSRHPGSSLLFSLRPLTIGCQPLNMMLQDGTLLELSRKEVMGPSSQD